MSSHTDFKEGDEVTFMRWNSGNSNHDEFDAVIRQILGAPGGHPTIHLSYLDGTAQDENNVKNVEELADVTGEDYWKRKHSEIEPGDSRPFRSTRESALSGFVWLAKYNATIEEHEFKPAVVLAVLGPGTDQDPRINCFYVESGTRTTVSNVEAHDDVVDPTTTTDDYWFDRVSDD